MKKIFKTLSLLSCALLLFASCDKIEDDNYLVFAGATFDWSNGGDGVADKGQRAFIEKYTGVRCINCPTADDAINAALAQYGDKLIAVAIHDSNLAFTRPYSGNTDMRTEDGDKWSKYFGVYATGEYPKAIVNRTKSGSSWDIFTPTSGINAYVDPIVSQSTVAALGVNAVKNGSNIDVTVNIEFLQELKDKLTLTLLIMEDGINASQSMPDGSRNDEYIHNHVLRDVITDIWGDDVDCIGNKTERCMGTLTYTDAKAEWDLSKCHIVALLSKKESKEVVNVAECEIE